MAKGNKGLTIFLCVLLGLLVAGLGVFCAFYFGFLGDGKAVLSYNGAIMENGQSLGQIESGGEFTVVGKDKYEVKIEAYATAENDFVFTVGDAEYSWRNQNGKDLTSGFSLTDEGGADGLYHTFKLSFDDFEGILAQYLNTEEAIEVPGGRPAEDIFKLTIVPIGAEKSVLEVTFSPLIAVESIVLTPEEVIF